jgi:hypothetical protein
VFNWHERQAPLVQRLLKVLSLGIYLYFLSALDSLSAYFIVPVVLATFIRLDFKTLSYIFLICFLLDPYSAWRLWSDYGPYSSFQLIESSRGTGYAWTLHLVVSTTFIFFAAAYIKFGRLFRAKSAKSTLLLTLTTIAAIYFSIQSIDLNRQISFIEFTVFGLALLMAKFLWIMTIGIICSESSQVTRFQLISGIVSFSPYVRENFDLNQYYQKSDRLFYKGIGLSAIVVAFYAVLPTVSGSGSLSAPPFCPAEIGAEGFLNSHPSIATIWKCWGLNIGIRTLVENLFISKLLLVVPGYLVGLNFKMPIGEFWKARTFSGLFSRLLYYYSLILERIFFRELDHFRWFRAGRISFGVYKTCLIFVSVVLGGYCIHLLRDINLILFLDETFLSHSWKFAGYLICIAILLSTGANRFFRNRLRTIDRIPTIFLATFWLFIFGFIRFLNSFYFLGEHSSRLSLLAKMFGGD